MYVYVLKCLMALQVYVRVATAVSCATDESLSSSSTCLKELYQEGGFQTVLEANEACVHNGFHMAKIVNYQDQDLMTKMLQNNAAVYGKTVAFLGGSDLENEGRFHWLDGSNVANVSWRDAKPNNEPVDCYSLQYTHHLELFLSGIAEMTQGCNKMHQQFLRTTCSEPNDSQKRGGEDCILMNFRGLLNDVACCVNRTRSYQTGVICEYDPADRQQHPSDTIFYEYCINSTALTMETATLSALNLENDTTATFRSLYSDTEITPTADAPVPAYSAGTHSTSRLLSPSRCTVKGAGKRLEFEIYSSIVRRNETNRYKKKLSCAHDARTSSSIIGVISCAIAAIPYLFFMKHHRQKRNATIQPVTTEGNDHIYV